MDPVLRRRFDSYIAGSGMTVSDGLRALVVRGLDGGRTTEAAWHAAYHNYRIALVGALRRKLFGPDFAKLVEDAFDEAGRSG